MGTWFILGLLQLATPEAAQLLLKNGDKAPPFSMRDVDKKMFSLTDYLGSNATSPKKAVVVIFFATWCEPCKKEIPIMRKIYSRWQQKGVEVVYLGMSQGEKELTPFVKENKLPWPVIPDSFGLLARRYGVAHLPHVIILNGAGEVAFQNVGIVTDLKDILDLQLSKITGAAVPAELADAGAGKVVEARFDKTFVLGRAPSSDGSSARWQPLATFVGEAVESQIEVATESSYETFEKSLKEGKYDIANAGPLLCYDVRQNYEPIIRIERHGSPTYFGLIFAKRAKGLEKLTDLKGKKIALVSPRSTSGGLYPQLALINAGLTPGKDVEIVWLGSHSKVAQAVKEGQVDAGGCYEDCRDAVWSEEAQKATETIVLSYTTDIPSEAIVVRRSLPEAIKAKIKKALLLINDNSGILAQVSQGESSPVTAFMAASAKDLEPIAAALAKVNPGSAVP